jgi:hypothetical protein
MEEREVGACAAPFTVQLVPPELKQSERILFDRIRENRNQPQPVPAFEELALGRASDDGRLTTPTFARSCSETRGNTLLATESAVCRRILRRYTG